MDLTDTLMKHYGGKKAESKPAKPMMASPKRSSGPLHIRKQGEKWCVMGSDGVIRGTHDSRWQAVKQSHVLEAGDHE